MKRLVGVLLLAVITGGCAHVVAPRATQLHSDQPIDATAKMLLSQMEKCWERPMTFAQDGLKVYSEQEIRGLRLKVSQVNYRGELDPFVIVSFDGTPGGSTLVNVVEGGYLNNFVNLTSHIDAWLQGNLACRPPPRS